MTSLDRMKNSDVRVGPVLIIVGWCWEYSWTQLNTVEHSQQDEPGSLTFVLVGII